MHCFVALERENPWLRDLDIERVNEGLAERYVLRSLKVI